MTSPPPILALASAVLPLGAEGDATEPLTLELGPDELALLDVGAPERAAAVADLACGTLAPRSGRVTFLGRDWREEPDETADALRGRIGRLFGADPWLPWLTVAENVLLAPLYHTRLPAEALRAQAARLARRFGLPGLPTGFPETVVDGDLVCAGLVRAFVGTPRLVVLEDPVGRLGAGLLPGLLAEIRAVRDAGGAVLWLRAGGAVTDRTLPATQRWRLVGHRLVPLAARAG